MQTMNVTSVTAIFNTLGTSFNYYNFDTNSAEAITLELMDRTLKQRHNYNKSCQYSGGLKTLGAVSFDSGH